MRTRDEVLRAFGTAQCVKGDNCADFDCVALNRMADRIRELESQQSASEPVAWAGHVRQLERCMAFQCGVAFALGHPLASAEEQAQAARAYSSGSHQPHPNAAGVREPVSNAYTLPSTVQAIVDAAVAYEQWQGKWYDYTKAQGENPAKQQRALIEAVRKHLTAASEGASDA